MKPKSALLGLVLLVLSLHFGCRPNAGNSSSPPPVTNWAARRAEMVDALAENVKDEQVLEAMRMVERHRFVPREMASQGYRQEALLIGEDQTISSPYIVARMTEMLELTGGGEGARNRYRLGLPGRRSLSPRAPCLLNRDPAVPRSERQKAAR